MGNSRPYWKVIVSLTFSLLATILFVVLGLKLMRFFMPFVLGWIIAWIANPMVCWLEKNGKIEALNLDFVIRIREYPRKKNGKKKTVILD